jgi:radical SAM protein with 4Fe4S-binding SPASM domain
MERIPEYAYTWRPFANPEMIYKEVVSPQGKPMVFTIDPWNQRWLVLQEPAPSLLKAANGRRRLSEIIRLLEAGSHLEGPANGYAGLAQELSEGGLLFNNQVEHRASGLPVYNKSDLVGMHLEITNACNMTCTHCYVASGNPLPGEMSLEEIFQAIDQLPPFSGKRIAISGGEPIVRKGCMEIIEHCALECGHDVDLYTNGRKFPRKYAERILEINRRGPAHVRIQISLEGAVAATNDAVRGAGSFVDALASLEMFQEIGLNRSVVIFVCLTRQNIGELKDIIRLAEKYDVGMLVFSQWQRQGNAQDTPWASIAPSVEDWVAVGEELLNYNNPRLRIFGNFYGDLNNNEIGRFSLDSPAFPKHLYFYNAFPRITPQGEIFADQLWVDRTWVLGSIRKNDTFEGCFDSPDFYRQLETMRKRTEAIQECQGCEWRRLCEGGSPGHTYAEYGHMNAKDLFCESRIYWFNRYVEHQVKKTVCTLR